MNPWGDDASGTGGGKTSPADDAASKLVSTTEGRAKLAPDFLQRSISPIPAPPSWSA